MEKHRKRRVVKIAALTGSGTVIYEDGTTDDLVFTGGDLALAESVPFTSCQRCGHLKSDHGHWQWDDNEGDEYWQSTSCKTERCDCSDWVDFTPWWNVP